MSESFIHPQAICESSRVGKGTRILAFAHISPGAAIGENCNIGESVFIDNDVHIGNEVIVKNGVQIGGGIDVGNRVIIGPNATFTNDHHARAQHRLKDFARITIKDDASIEAHATILPGVTIGYGAVVRPGAVALRDVPARAIIAGNPARVVGYANARDIPAGQELKLPPSFQARVISLRSHFDHRGTLTVCDSSSKTFHAKRFFLVHHVPLGEDRGSHAHRTGQQLFMAVSGQLSVALDDGKEAYAVRLSNPCLGIYVPPLTWSMQYEYSTDAALLVACSDDYDRSAYVSDYNEFRRLTNN